MWIGQEGHRGAHREVREKGRGEREGGGVSVDVSVSVPFFVIKKLGSCIL